MGKRLYLYDQTNKETRLKGIEQRYSSYKELYTMGLGPKRFQFGPRKEVRGDAENDRAGLPTRSS